MLPSYRYFMLNILASTEAAKLREFFANARFNSQEFRNGPLLADWTLRRFGVPPYFLDCTREPTLLNLLWRLFLIGLPVNRADFAALVPAVLLDTLRASGLITLTEGEVIGSVSLMPVDEFLFASDSAERQFGHAPDLVLWPNQTTRALQLATIRRPVEATLDLGSGCGILAVMAAGSSQRVVATDLNPRAAEFARFNAWLNGFENIEATTGDTFEPVRGQTFDLIVANPPFFVSPASNLMYCENGMELDQYCRRVVREAQPLLRDGGYLQMLFEWVQVSGQKWQDRLAEWVEGSGCDVWVMRTYSRSASGYAHERTKEDFAAGPAAASVKFNEWVAYYREREVEHICGGLLVMRKRAGENWVRFEELHMDDSSPIGDAILDLFATQTILSANLPDQELLSLRPRLSDQARMQQHLQAQDGRLVLTAFNLVMTGALPATMSLESQVADFLAKCDGVRTLDQLAQDLAAKARVPVEQVRQQCCAIVRKLSERRFLQLAG